MRASMALFAFLISCSVHGQTLDSLRTGSRIRVRTENRSLVGTFDRLESQTLYMTGDRDHGLDLARIERIECSTKRSGHPVVGALTGAMFGLMIGAAITGSSNDSPQGSGGIDSFGDSIGDDVNKMFAMMILGSMGRLMIGNEIKTDRWEEIRIRGESEAFEWKEPGSPIRLAFSVGL